MASDAVSFLDLPGEMRNTVYERYLSDMDVTEIIIFCGEILPPDLARASCQVRKESLPYWKARKFDKEQIQCIHGAVVNLDFSPLMRFFHALLPDTVSPAGMGLFCEQLKLIKLHLDFHEDWTLRDTKDRIREWVRWLPEDRTDMIIKWEAEAIEPGRVWRLVM